jgi:hypothetical protein
LAVAKKSKSQFDPRAFLAKADGGVAVSIYRRGEVVFTQGDPADSIFFIQVGKVKVTVVSQQGKEAVIAFLEAGDFIGEGCLTGRPRRVSTARALTDSTLTRLDKSTMVRMLRDEPNFSELFTAHLLSRTLVSGCPDPRKGGGKLMVKTTEAVGASGFVESFFGGQKSGLSGSFSEQLTRSGLSWSAEFVDQLDIIALPDCVSQIIDQFKDGEGLLGCPVGRDLQRDGEGQAVSDLVMTLSCGVCGRAAQIVPGLP